MQLTRLALRRPILPISLNILIKPMLLLRTILRNVFIISLAVTAPGALAYPIQGDGEAQIQARTFGSTIQSSLKPVRRGLSWLFTC